ncbi:MAG: hypothetical protein COB85_03590 [Bacteroidetes bacterium]|nr:MAG: hypothetical protein COB85_03590 [Bacteroidota bacterium]
MRKSILCLVILFIFSFSTKAQLAGTYTVGSGGDFTTWTEAIDSLVSLGVSAPVVMNVFDGNYLEQLTIPAITGASATNTITFQSGTQDSLAVLLFFGSTQTNNFVVKLNGADYIIFNQITIATTGTSYSRVVYFLAGASNNTITNSVLVGAGNNPTSTNNAVVYSYNTQDENNTFQNNVFTNGSYGIYLRGASTSVLSVGNVVQNNQFVDNYYYSIWMAHQSASVIAENSVTMNNSASTAYGIYTSYIDNSLLIQKNTVTLTGGGYGIYMFNCDGNFVQKGEVSNNMVSLGGTGTSYGIYSNGSSYQNIWHNSTRVLGNTSSGRAFSAASGGNLDVRNNSFRNSAWGFAYYTNSTTNIAVSDNNNLFGTGNYLAYWNANYEDLPALQAGSGKDANSVSVNPNYFSVTDLHTNVNTMESMGDGTVGLSTDIDGDTRSGSPDIGADEFTGVGTPLTGVYTVGGTTPDFATVSDAVDSMNIVGISAAVTFDIRDGSYNEQFQVYPITGSSNTSRVIFQSENRDSSLVDISFAASSSAYVFRLRAADYVTIRDLTISATGTSNGVAIRLSGNPKWDSIYNCELVGNTSVSSDATVLGNESYFNNISIQNNFFSSGYYGIRMDCADAILSSGINISNNNFSGQSEYGMYLEDMNAAVVMNNTVDVVGHSGFTGIHLNDVENDFILTFNKITAALGTDGGLKIDYCNGTSSNRGLVANNIVIAGGTAAAYGIYTRYSDYVNVFHNSTRISSSSLTSGLGYYNLNGTFIDVRNNMFTNFGGGYAYYANNGTAITSSDFNNLFTTGNFVGYWNGAARSTLADFQSANSMDVSSISLNPVFVSSSDLHVQSTFVNDLGTPIGSVTLDIDGDARSGTNPDMGADEFTPDTSVTPLIGAYTIGGTSPDYIDFTAAVDDLSLRGIAGVVTFNVRPDTYTEHVIVLPISGSSATDTVVFQSENGDSSSVVLTYNAAVSGDDYVFRLYGASYVTIQNMTLIATGSSFSRVINLNGSVTNVNILNNIISGTPNASSSLIHSFDDKISDIRIHNNFLSEGEWGVYINGDNSLHVSGIVVTNNIITSSKTNAIRLEDCSAPIVMWNDCSNSGINYNGILLSDCDSKFKVIGNKVVSSDYYTGIYIYLCNGSAPFRGVVANNFCSVGGGGSSYGIRLYNSSYVDVWHNNINVTSTSTSGRAFYLGSGGTDVTVKNNNFVNTGPGYAFYVSTTTAITSTDFNNIFGGGTNIGYWGGNTATFADLQTASGMDANSISVNPVYNSATDLHVGALALMGAATPVGITDDIDGQARDLVNPDIGADEFFCQTPVFNVAISDPCLGDSTAYTDLSTLIESGSTWDWDFNGDLTTDYTSNTGGETISYLFLTAGTQTGTLIVSQIAGCVDTFMLSATVNTFPTLSITSTGVYCDSSNGTATVVATSGTAPYTYTWSSGSTSTEASNLDLGLYTIAVTDVNNCTTLDTVSIVESFQIAVVEISPSTCGNTDGIATVSSVSGGYPPYAYAWSSGDTTDIDSNLSSGVTYVTVIDVNGCVAYATIDITDSDTGPSIGLTSQTNNLCAGEQNGVIDILVVGGTTPYSIIWSNGETSQDIDSLGEGIYELTVTDALGCVAAESYTITAPYPMASTSVVSDATCGVSDGSAVVVVSGGTLPYSYNWQGGGTDQIKSGLTAGIYSVTVTDNNGCTIVAPIIVNNVGGPALTLLSTTSTDCNNLTAGAIDIIASGGTSPYAFLWSNTDTTEDVSGLTLGQYTVTVTDAASCEAAIVVDIEDLVPAVQEICVVTVDSITGKNLVVWEKDTTIGIDYFNIWKEGTQSGNYQLIGTRPLDSVSVFHDSLSDPGLKSWRYKISAVDLCGQESDLSSIHKTLHLTINLALGGGYNLIWDGYSGLPISSYVIYSGPAPDVLTALTVVSGNSFTYTHSSPPVGTSHYIIAAQHPFGGCSAFKAKNYNSSKSNSTSVNSVAPPVTLSMATTSTNTSADTCDGTATASVSGGTPPYTYVWGTSPVQTSSLATGLCANTFNVTVFDSSGDSIISTATVNQNVGIEDNDLNNLVELYPNPNRGTFILSFKQEVQSPVALSIYNIKGELIYKRISSKGTGYTNQVIDISNHSAGIYYLRIVTEKGIVHKKVIIE